MSFFIYGFSKNQQDNIDQKELKALKLMAKSLLGYSGVEIEKAINANELIEVKYHE